MNLSIDPSKRFDLTVRYPKDVVQMSGGPQLSWKPVEVQA